ncbi:hypothetical protein [Idiomarina sp. UBA1919]|jgi:hypothetical protein|nr:hypothetical protein [Idiomarina sp. UBA1919]|tara:strand:- start:2182 stop:2322 length:141 start_codon:yes stop_codon:yes gene_type:complete
MKGKMNENQNHQIRFQCFDGALDGFFECAVFAVFSAGALLNITGLI